MNEKIAQRIKEKRLKAGISQESLSHLADLDRKYVGIIEKGQTNISIKVLSQLCDALDVSLSDFFKDLWRLLNTDDPSCMAIKPNPQTK